MKLWIIDEDDGNPFTREGELEQPLLFIDEDDYYPISYTCGYYISSYSPTKKEITEVGNKHKRVVNYLLEILNVKGEFLDIGYGRNIFVSVGAEEYGMKANALTTVYGCYDNVKTIKTYDLIPRDAKKNEYSEEDKIVKNMGKDVRILRGDIFYALHKNSVIKDKKFGMQTIWGAYFTSGNNFIIAYNMKYLKGKEKPDNIIDEEFPSERYLFKIMRELCDENSLFAVISSRYCYRGQGIMPIDLPKEKIDFLNLLYNVMDMLKKDIKEIIIIGISKDAWKRKIEISRDEYKDEWELERIYKGVLESWDYFNNVLLIDYKLRDIDIALIDAVVFRLT